MKESIVALVFFIFIFSHPSAAGAGGDTLLVTGAERTQKVRSLLMGKQVGVVANQTSLVGGVHLVDTLLAMGIDVKKVFAPEHGFRGEAGPGDVVNSGSDPRTGLPVVSLYGSHKKPTQEDLAGLDAVVFDIQDVGARFYTYISTLQYVMEACAEYHVKLIVLDRPNPHGQYIDGPVLDTAFRSFVGIAPIPIVHGLTVGEYAKMSRGENWGHTRKKVKLRVVQMLHYDHQDHYDLPVRPSPNLPNMESIWLYPSLCLFEGTKVSVGRGTGLPFQMIGFPGLQPSDTSFCPEEIPGVIKDPPYEGIECNGIDLRGNVPSLKQERKLNLGWLLQMYDAYPRKEIFFTSFFDKLAGTNALRKQIVAGFSEEQIRAGWNPGLEAFGKLRKKYMLYPDGGTD